MTRRVADSRDGSSPQPVRRRVAEILATAGYGPGGLPEHFTHRQLAQRVYDTPAPRPAQLSAVRRAVAQLVKAGQAERDGERAWDRANGTHERRVRGVAYCCANPGGVLIRRVLTVADRETRAAFAETRGYADWADRIRQGEAPPA